MSQKAGKIAGIVISNNWTGLVKLWPLRPIRDEVDYNNALEIASELAARNSGRAP